MKALSALLGLMVVAILAVGLQAEPNKGKEVKLTGKLVCGKCALSETEACSNVLQVKEGDKTINYYFNDKGKKEEYHNCSPAKTVEATVTGEVTEKDGKKYITASKVEVKK